MSRNAICAGAMFMLLALALSASAEDKKVDGDPLKKDTELLQGKWERVMTTDTSVLGKAKRAVKEFDGDTEIVTWYNDKDEVIRSHRVTFKLSELGKLHIYTYSDMEILDGPGKGQKVKGTASYVYRVGKDFLFETSGFCQDELPFCTIARWKKMEEK
jgi:hypothetical protein